METVRVSGSGSADVEAFVRKWNDSEPFIEAHTSGSTGKPKAIRLLKRDMLVSAEKTCRFFGIDRDSLLGLPLSLSYIAGKMMAVRALASGAELWCEQPSMNLLNDYTMGRKIDLLSVVPAQIPNLLNSGRMDYVKHLLIGGAPLSYKSEAQLLDAKVSAFCSYGMTETCSHVALRKIGTHYYTGLDGISFSIDDRGCLVIRLEDFSIGEITTNDIVKLIDENRFEWLGRYDNVINSGGIKLQPEAIELKIADCLPENNYYISWRASERWGEEIVLVVESASEIANLMHEISKRLTLYETPKAIIYKKILERTTSGKIKRQHQ